MPKVRRVVGTKGTTTRSMAALVWLLVGCAGQAAPVGVSPGVAGSRTAWDGIFTAAQARRGEAVVQSHCDRCHTEEGWPFVVDRWSGRPLVELFDTMRAAMPLEYPGGLQPGEYAAIIAYVLRLSGAPTGPGELSTEREVLAEITVTPRPGG